MPEWNLPPDEIERRSLAIIDREAQSHAWDGPAWSIVRRMVHTTGDFDFVDLTRMHPRAVGAGVQAIRAGRTIFTDTNMARSGISARRLEPFGCSVTCLMSDPQVARRAREAGLTRAAAAVDAVADRLEGCIYAVGNAPTALFRLLEHMDAGRAAPALVVGVPVGFVNAAESKQALAETDYPHITALGRKGGSALAASVVNALAILCGKEE